MAGYEDLFLQGQNGLSMNWTTWFRLVLEIRMSEGIKSHSPTHLDSVLLALLNTDTTLALPFMSRKL
jgi:hypothetical protein